MTQSQLTHNLAGWVVKLKIKIDESISAVLLVNPISMCCGAVSRFVREEDGGRTWAQPTLPGLKLAAAIGAASTVKVTIQRPPRRRKKDPGLSSAHEYRTLSLRAEYSFTCTDEMAQPTPATV